MSNASTWREAMCERSVASRSERTALIPPPLSSATARRVHQPYRSVPRGELACEIRGACGKTDVTNALGSQQLVMSVSPPHRRGGDPRNVHAHDHSANRGEELLERGAYGSEGEAARLACHADAHARARGAEVASWWSRREGRHACHMTSHMTRCLACQLV